MIIVWIASAIILLGLIYLLTDQITLSNLIICSLFGSFGLALITIWFVGACLEDISRGDAFDDIVLFKRRNKK